MLIPTPEALAAQPATQLITKLTELAGRKRGILASIAKKPIPVVEAGLTRELIQVSEAMNAFADELDRRIDGLLA